MSNEQTPSLPERFPSAYYTQQETTALLVQQADVIIDQWDKMDLSENPEHEQTQRARIAGAVYGVFAMLDGASHGIPACSVRMYPPDPETVDSNLAKGLKIFSSEELSGTLAFSFQQMNEPNHPLAGFRKEYQEVYLKATGIDQFVSKPGPLPGPPPILNTD